MKPEQGVFIIHGTPPNIQTACMYNTLYTVNNILIGTVKIEKTVLLAILTGALDPMIAFMCGNISIGTVK